MKHTFAMKRRVIYPLICFSLWWIKRNTNRFGSILPDFDIWWSIKAVFCLKSISIILKTSSNYVCIKVTEYYENHTAWCSCLDYNHVEKGSNYPCLSVLYISFKIIKVNHLSIIKGSYCSDVREFSALTVRYLWHRSVFSTLRYIFSIVAITFKF